jgi:hypothetical protein
LKKILALLLTLLVVINTNSATFASATPQVLINGKTVKFSNTTGQPFLQNYIFYAPLKVVAEKSGFIYKEDKTKKTCTISDKSTKIEIKQGTKSILINGNEDNGEAIPIVKNSILYYPLYKVFGILSKSADWDASINVMKINDYRYGTIDLSDGGIYEGYLINGLPWGMGTAEWIDGSDRESYSGEWYKGVMHGEGEYTSLVGNVLTGQFMFGSFYKGDIIQGEDGTVLYENEVRDVKVKSKYEFDFKYNAKLGPKYDTFSKNVNAYKGRLTTISGELVFKEKTKTGVRMVIDLSGGANGLIDLFNYDEADQNKISQVGPVFVEVIASKDNAFKEGQLVTVYGTVKGTSKLVFTDGTSSVVPSITLGFIEEKVYN